MARALWIVVALALLAPAGLAAQVEPLVMLARPQHNVQITVGGGLDLSDNYAYHDDVPASVVMGRSGYAANPHIGFSYSWRPWQVRAVMDRSEGPGRIRTVGAFGLPTSEFGFGVRARLDYQRVLQNTGSPPSRFDFLHVEPFLVLSSGLGCCVTLDLELGAQVSIPFTPEPGEGDALAGLVQGSGLGLDVAAVARLAVGVRMNDRVMWMFRFGFDLGFATFKESSQTAVIEEGTPDQETVPAYVRRLRHIYLETGLSLMIGATSEVYRPRVNPSILSYELAE